MNFLITNDDGIEAEGLATLANIAKNFGQITVVAPEKNNSAVSSALTIKKPLQYKEIKPGWFSVNGTPADCMHLATFHIMNTLPDIVISGINDGSNLGDDVLYSGTLAGALEARFIDRPAFAFSLETGSERMFNTAYTIVEDILVSFSKNADRFSGIYNVNIPNCSIEQVNGYEVTRLGHRARCEAPMQIKQAGTDAVYYRIAPPGDSKDNTEGTDFKAISNRFVSITPIQIDMTKYSEIEPLKIIMSSMNDNR
jgi:5'-nucleotidase